jgi:fatty acid desaturase
MCTEPDRDQVVADAAERDWTDKSVKPSERKKRDRVLPDGVVLRLMKKSDWEGCKRFFSNVGFMLLTAYVIHKLDVYPALRDATSFDDLRSVLWSRKIPAFVPLYLFYGFQMQCMAFAGGHELIHGSAFKTRWMNVAATFCVSTAFFEVSWHEKFNHKQHHIYTLDIDRDPELTSFYSRKELENLKFKSVPESRYSWLKAFVDVLSYFQHRACRLVSGAMGIMTDYTGTGYSMTSPRRDEIDPAVVRDLRFWSALQLSVYLLLSLTVGRTPEGRKAALFWWIAPCVLGYGPINYFRNAEHADCDLVPNQLHNTRTVESNFVARWLLWETNYHCEHHAYPAVPFYNLPKLHELLDPHIKHNDCKTFTAQQVAMLRGGGWIDKQNS